MSRLTLTCREGSSIVLADGEITLHFGAVKGKRAKVTVVAPRDIPIRRIDPEPAYEPAQVCIPKVQAVHSR